MILLLIGVLNACLSAALMRKAHRQPKRKIELMLLSIWTMMVANLMVLMYIA